jgi:phosphomannomutase
MAMSGPLMLGVSGCRGIVGESLTPEVVARFAGVLAGYVAERAPGRRPTIVLARDGRAGCEVVVHAAIAGVIGAGCDVVDLGVAMTPTAAVAVDRLSGGRAVNEAGVAGIVLTASHNPQVWNGLKAVVPDGANVYGSSACAPPASVANELVERFRAGRVGLAAWDRVGAVQRDDGAELTHVNRVGDALAAAGVAEMPEDLGAGLAVVVDSVNSSGVGGARAMLESLGCGEILHLGHETTGIFPHPPEPLRENLGELAAAVRETEAQVGFAQDPDADRLAIIDERGEYIGEEYTLALGALALLEAEQRTGTLKPGRVLVTNLSTSRMLEDIAERFGARVVRTPVGEANVVEAMKREGAAAGGEGNGGLIWPRVAYVRDSLSSMAMVLALLQGGKRTLSEIVASLPSYAILKRKVDLASKEAATPAVQRIAQHYASQRLDTRDGVRVDFNDYRGGKAWLHVRASNTEPIMRLIAEAGTPQSAAALLDEASVVIG